MKACSFNKPTDDCYPGSLNTGLQSVAMANVAHKRSICEAISNSNFPLKQNPVNLDFSSLLDCLPTAILVLDNQGCVIYSNNKSYSLFGKSIENELWRNTIDRCFKKMEANTSIETMNGQMLNLESAPLENKRGQVLIFHDVTQTQEYIKMKEHISRLAEMGEMAAKLAHQLRTPLAASMLYLSNSIKKLKLVSNNDIGLEKCMAGMRHLEMIVSNMLMFSSSLKLATDEVNLEDIFVHIQRESVVIEEEFHCRINYSLDLNVKPFRGSSVAVKSAISNIIVNAAQSCAIKKKNSSPGDFNGVVNVNLVAADISNEEYSIEILIEDNGIGIHKDLLNKITNPFFTTKANGTGLGLSVVNSVVRDHNGMVDIKSTENVGTKVKVLLP